MDFSLFLRYDDWFFVRYTKNNENHLQIYMNFILIVNLKVTMNFPHEVPFTHDSPHKGAPLGNGTNQVFGIHFARHYRTSMITHFLLAFRLKGTE